MIEPTKMFGELNNSASKCSPLKQAIVGGVLFCLLSACATKPSLMPTPSIFLKNSYVSDSVPDELQKPEMDLIYVTDRAPLNTYSANKGGPSAGTVRYGFDRSSSMAFGLVTVGFTNKDLSWQELVKSSSELKRQEKFIYNINSIDEIGRFPGSPYAFNLEKELPVIVEPVAAERDRQKAELQKLIVSKLAEANSHDVVLYVHGVSNDFDDAAYTLAGFWHFLGRKVVPIVYSWPAGIGGIKGYFTDRESGEFTVFHLKETLRVLSAMQEIENIHIIAHSRGTDITTTALRELIIELRGSKTNPRTALKVTNLVLAAADLDFGVMQQRLMAEQFGLAFGEITLYTSQGDKALGLSQYLMSGVRSGRLRSEDILENEQSIFAEVGNVNFINVPKAIKFLGHDYFRNNQLVSSDLITLLLSGAKPESAQRQLIHLGSNFWQLRE